MTRSRYGGKSPLEKRDANGYVKQRDRPGCWSCPYLVLYAQEKQQRLYCRAASYAKVSAGGICDKHPDKVGDSVPTVARCPR